MPQISVITSVYNTERYLPACIESVLGQTFKDLELILVDDGSPDGSAAICDAYAAKDARVRVVHKPNGGPATASNAGLNAARGRYIGFVDSDDVIEPAMYETLYNAVQQSGCAMAACGSSVIDENGQPLPGGVKTTRTGKLDALDLFYDVFQNGSMYGMLSWNKLFDAGLFANIRYDETLLFGDDCSILHRVYDGQSVYCLNDPLYRYRYRAGSITAQLFHIRQLDNLTIYADWCDFLAQKPGKQDLAQWGLARYWQVFYLYYVHANLAGQAQKPEVQAGFAKHLARLRGMLPALLACPHISAAEKLRARLFCRSPRLAYQLAAGWGRLHGKG